MTIDRSYDYLASLVRELRGLPGESEWVEFKVNKCEPQEIGEYISALANSATLVGKPFAYMVWGVADSDHRVVGTTFSPGDAKVGNEALESWLLRLLVPGVHFRFFELCVAEHPVVVLEIERAYRQPVQFRGQTFVRVGSYKKRLKDLPERERSLWRSFDQTPFEHRVAAERVRDEDVLERIDYPAYFDLLRIPLPDNRNGILRALASDGLIHRSDAGGWNVTNLAAALFAKRLAGMPTLRRKALRIIQYRGSDRTDASRERVETKGYAAGFNDLMRYIQSLLPYKEVIGQAFRETIVTFPEIAVRELVVNALIHQDFHLTGTGPMVEVFANRIEVTNPGTPLVDAERFVDSAPRSRNESLAAIMRRIGICEERGSGWDKIVSECERHRLPAPLVEVMSDHTRVVLFAPRPLASMDKAERVRATYLHACLRYVNREYLTNASLRQRFAIEARNSARASRLIGEAVKAGAIAPDDPDAAPRLMRYVPWWTKSDSLSIT